MASLITTNTTAIGDKHNNSITDDWFIANIRLEYQEICLDTR
jgi:hypothetical protein